MKTTEENLTDAVNELAGAFTTATRENGDTFIKLRDDAPAWIDDNDVIMYAHEALDDRLPDDWTYQAISNIADHLGNYPDSTADDLRDEVPTIADNLVSNHNSDLCKWAADHLGNVALIDEAAEELGRAEDFIGSIRQGQYFAIERIAHAVIDKLEAESFCRDTAEEIDA